MASWFNDIISTGKDFVTDKVSKTATDIASLLNPGRGRLKNAGLNKNGQRTVPSRVDKASINYADFTKKGSLTDWRVRVSTSPAVHLYGADTAITAPLARTNGVIFPYTPQINVVHQANYSPQKFTHSNYPFYSYENSEVQAIQITADFTVQNQDEAKYLLACIYFFRAATKMYFGKSSNPGNPPPIVFLDGYGTHYFPHVPCVVTQFTHNMPADVDYIETDITMAQSTMSNQTNAKGAMQTGGKNKLKTPLAQSVPSSGNQSTRVPTSSQITIVLQPVYSKKSIGNFNLDDFAKGKLISGNGGFI